MLLDANALASLSKMDPSIAEISAKNPMPQLDWQDADALKAMVAMSEKMRNDGLGPPEAALHEWYGNFALQDGGEGTFKAVRPASSSSGGGPLVVLFFGGGWISGSQEQTTHYARALARAFGAVVVSPQYRLAPEHPFPTQATDCFEALTWISHNATALGADPSKGFVVGGISAGAHGAAVAARVAQESALAYPLTGQWLAIPAIFMRDDVPEKFKEYFVSREQNAEAPILDKAAVQAIERHVRWSGPAPLPYRTPFAGSLTGMPPTFLQVCGMDPLRDDGLIYEEMLKEAGVKTRINVYPGCPHGHWSTFEGLEISKLAYADVMTGFGWLLNMDITPKAASEALTRRDQ